MRLMPGPEEEVMARVPVQAAPQIMLIPATSLSHCRKTPPASGSLLAMYSKSSFWGVMGYPA
jgi:hypothetical protein